MRYAPIIVPFVFSTIFFLASWIIFKTGTFRPYSRPGVYTGLTRGISPVRFWFGLSLFIFAASLFFVIGLGAIFGRIITK